MSTVGATDAYYSGWHYAGALLDDYQSSPDAPYQTPGYYTPIMTSLYLVMYVLYYSAGNIDEAAAMVQTIKENRDELMPSRNCMSFLNRGRVSESTALLSDSDLPQSLNDDVMPSSPNRFCAIL